MVWLSLYRVETGSEHSTCSNEWGRWVSSPGSPDSWHPTCFAPLPRSPWWWVSVSLVIVFFKASLLAHLHKNAETSYQHLCWFHVLHGTNLSGIKCFQGRGCKFSSWHNSAHAHRAGEMWTFPLQKAKLRLKLIPVMEILTGLFKKSNLALILWPVLYVPIIFPSTLFVKATLTLYSPEKFRILWPWQYVSSEVQNSVCSCLLLLGLFTRKPSQCVRDCRTPSGLGRSMPSAFKQVQRMAREPT